MHLPKAGKPFGGYSQLGTPAFFSRQGVIWIASQKAGEVKEWASGAEARGKPLNATLGLLRCEEESPLLL